MFSPNFLTEITTAAAIVLGITEMIKRGLVLSGFFGYLISFILSFLVTLPKLIHDPVQYFVLAVFTFLTANGVFKAVHR